MKIKQWIQNKRKSQKGFTLLFAVLVSTLVVAIGATVVSIALRQTILSGTSRESQYAFYAANTALECAFYWDVIGTGAEGAVFPYDFGPELFQVGVSDTSGVTCAGGNIVSGSGFEGDSFVYADGGWTQDTNTTTFKIEISDNTDDMDHRYCAEVTVTKSAEDGTTVQTVIQAKGYNTCDLDNPRAVERGLVQSYES